MFKTAVTIFLMLLFGGCSLKNPDVDFSVGQDYSWDRRVAWWHKESPTLQKLLEDSVKSAFFLNAKRELLNQSYYGYESSRGDLYPSLDLSISGNKNDLVSGEGQSSEGQGISLLGSYDIDLWGRLREGVNSAKYEQMVKIQEVSEATRTYTLNIAQSYYKYLENLALKRVLRKQIAANEKVLEAIKNRHLFGSAEYSDILQQRTSLLSLNSELESTQASINIQQRKLEYLTNRALKIEEEDLGACQNIDITPLMISDIILLAPNVQSAYFLMESRDAKLAVAVAKQYPALSFSLSLSSATSSFGLLFENWILSSVAKAVQPIFDAGALEMDEKIAMSALKESYFLYRDTLLEEAYKLEENLINLRDSLKEVESLKKRMEISEQAFELIKTRYIKGASTYLEMTSALQSFQDAEKRFVTAQRSCKTYQSEVKSIVNLTRSGRIHE